MSTAKGQALADEYGIKFYETVWYSPHNLSLFRVSSIFNLQYVNGAVECKDKHECWGSFLFNCKKHNAKARGIWFQDRGTHDLLWKFWVPLKLREKQNYYQTRPLII